MYMSQVCFDFAFVFVQTVKKKVAGLSKGKEEEDSMEKQSKQLFGA
jgi:hypothetical protein